MLCYIFRYKYKKFHFETHTLVLFRSKMITHLSTQ